MELMPEYIPHPINKSITNIKRKGMHRKRRSFIQKELFSGGNAEILIFKTFNFYIFDEVRMVFSVSFSF